MEVRRTPVLAIILPSYTTIRWWAIEAGGGAKTGTETTQTLVLTLTPGGGLGVAGQGRDGRGDRPQMGHDGSTRHRRGTRGREGAGPRGSGWHAAQR